MKHHRYSLFLALAGLSTSVALPLEAAPVTTTTAASPANARAVAALTQGVNEIAAPGLPGIVATTSGSAFPVIAGKIGKQGRESVVAAAMNGKTRIVAFGHDGYIETPNLAVADTAKLLDNALNWTAGGQKPARVGVLASDEVLSGLKARGYNAVAVSNGEFSGFSTLVINGHQLKDADRAPLERYLSNGGGLVIATTGWGWPWPDNAKTLSADFVGNQVLAPYGLVWTMGTLDKTSDKGFKVEPVTPLANAQAALRLLQGSEPASAEQSEQVSSVLGSAMTGLPASDTQILPALKAMAAGTTGEVVPFERAPVTAAQPKARLLLMLQTGLEKNLPAEAVKPHPAGAIFPGDVPPNVKPVAKTVTIDTAVPQWHSLGLYAAPGAPVTIKLPDGVAPNGLSVRIGAHTDTLYHLNSWKRAPDISRSWPLGAGQTKVANPFGGLVYIVVPDEGTARKLDVSVSGAVEAPLWVQGQTSLADWKNTVRWAPGPWAEIATGKVILTVPSRAIRDLDDPTALSDFYNKGMDAAADLYGISRNRKRPERFVADVQISAGYMHSGYPIMTWLDVEKTTVDLAQLTKFPWGHWHEMGHNHQKGEWTFEGTGEVTNNLLPLYVWNTVLGHDLYSGHPAIARADWPKRWAKYKAGGHQFKDWQSDPWLALEMYMQMQSAFGWEPFKKVFAEYNTLSDAQKPKTELEKHDQWMVGMARATGKNLGPFFQQWGVPTSPEARASIANLPAWMPQFPSTP